MGSVRKIGSMSREMNLEKSWQCEEKGQNAYSSALFPDVEGKKKIRVRR